MFRLGYRIRGPVARRAILGRRFIEEHRLPGHHFRQFVAFPAAHVLVRATQRKLGALLVVKQRRLPLHAVMAIDAAGDVVLRELLPVDVLVAILALARRSLEIHVHQVGFKVGGFVAIDASRSPVSAEQRKFCLGMVKAGKLLP